MSHPKLHSAARSAAILTAVVLATSAPAGAAQPALVWMTVRCEKAGTNVPVRAAIELPADLAKLPPEEVRAQVCPASDSGTCLPAQVVLTHEGQAELWWVLPEAEAGTSRQWTATLERKVPARPAAPAPAFEWRKAPDGQLDLVFGGRPVLRCMHAFDDPQPGGSEPTSKVFHHVFGPEGKDFITKGAGGRYPHHRGLFIGFSKLAYDGGKRGDWWHTKNVTQVHQEFLQKAAGPVLARSVARIHWNDPEGKPVLVEERTVTAFRQPEPTLALVFHRSKLAAVRSDVTLDGDPEHAGMQYRPHNDVAGNKSATYLFPRPEVTSGNVKNEADLPWAALQYQLGDETYCVQHMNHPANPKDTRYSAYRDYGRFGAFAKATIAKGESLVLRYRVWVVDGEMLPRERLQAQYEAFAHPPQVTVGR